MEKINVLDKYPVIVVKMQKDGLTMEKIIENLKTKIESDPIATFIDVFDHYAHTKSINWEISDQVKDAKILLFCFGKAIAKPEILAVRPRNLVVVETENEFIFEWLEAPQQPANEKIAWWVNSL